MPNIPSEMTAIEIPTPGGPNSLKAGRRPVPEPAVGEVLIKIKTAGVNRADTMQREGRYPMPPGETDIPGLEASGEVVALGEGTSRFQVGDEVCALLSGGGYAEFVNAPEPQCMALPPKVDVVAGAELDPIIVTATGHLVDEEELYAARWALAGAQRGRDRD